MYLLLSVFSDLSSKNVVYAASISVGYVFFVPVQPAHIVGKLANVLTKIAYLVCQIISNFFYVPKY